MRDAQKVDNDEAGSAKHETDPKEPAPMSSGEGDEARHDGSQCGSTKRSHALLHTISLFTGSFLFFLE